MLKIPQNLKLLKSTIFQYDLFLKASCQRLKTPISGICVRLFSYQIPRHAPSLATNRSIMPSLVGNPVSSLVDDRVAIASSGLEPKEPVTLAFLLKDEKIKMSSYAHYEADENGTVDITTMPSLGGSYDGVEPMGFIWSMKPTADQPPSVRLMKRDVCTPLTVDVTIYSGHLQVDDPENFNSECLATTELKRWYKSDDVERIEVNSGRLVATLFVPKTAGSYPGILDLFGSVGGLVEYRASLLASRGFITMALSYWHGKKGQIQELEYFEEALDFLASQPKVQPGGLGILGVSTGAEMGLLTSIVTGNKVRAYVGINGPPIATISKRTYKDEVFEPTFWPRMVKGDKGAYLTMDEEKDVLNILPIERSQGKHLLITGTEDGMIYPIAHKTLPKRMVEKGRPAEDCQAVVYQDAGHLIEPPYSPHCEASFTKMYNVIFHWGGQPKPHAFAQEDSWRRIQEFFKTTMQS